MISSSSACLTRYGCHGYGRVNQQPVARDSGVLSMSWSGSEGVSGKKEGYNELALAVT
jgi:hypothetical protein